MPALDDIAYNSDVLSWNRDTMRDANGLLAAIEKFYFFYTLCCFQCSCPHSRANSSITTDKFGHSSGY